MAEQLPVSVGANPSLPPLAIDDGALLKFSRDLNLRLKELELQYATPRRHPRMFFGQSRMAPRKPR